jgi:hypothetical protein
VPVEESTVWVAHAAIGLPPSLNATVPLGWPAPGAVGRTEALNVTPWPLTDGFADELTVVAVSALLITCVSAFDVLVLKLLSPL